MSVSKEENFFKDKVEKGKCIVRVKEVGEATIKEWKALGCSREQGKVSVKVNDGERNLRGEVKGGLVRWIRDGRALREGKMDASTLIFACWSCTLQLC